MVTILIDNAPYCTHTWGKKSNLYQIWQKQKKLNVTNTINNQKQSKNNYVNNVYCVHGDHHVVLLN